MQVFPRLIQLLFCFQSVCLGFIRIWENISEIWIREEKWKSEWFSSTMASSLRFLENEKVLCFHGPLIYEAKVQKVRWST